MIIETIELLRGGNHYGAGELTEFAKGKEQMIFGIDGIMRKVKRKKYGKSWSKKYTR